MNRLHFNNSRPGILTVKHLNNAIIDNQQLHLVFSMVKIIFRIKLSFVRDFVFLARTNIRTINGTIESSIS